MNEIRLAKGQESLTVEVELPASDPSGLGSPGGRDLIGVEVEGPPPPEPEPEPEPEADGPPPPPAKLLERRVSQRYRSVQGRCWIGWHDGVNFRQSAAWILDISLSGGLIAADVPPPTNRSIWLRLDDPAVTDWAETRVIELKASPSGIAAARLVFRGSCPYAFMKAVAFSPPGSRPAQPGHSAFWDVNSW
jgi:hypothetical protein